MLRLCKFDLSRRHGLDGDDDVSRFPEEQPSMATLIVVAGLPGSGKSTLIKQMQADDPSLGLVEGDHMGNSHGHSPRLKDSRHHETLIRDLSAGKNCVIGDIEFVRTEKRRELEDTVRAAAPDVEIKWICFENDWIECLKNVNRRAGPDYSKFEKDATAIVKLTRHHSTHLGAEVRAVYKEPSPRRRTAHRRRQVGPSQFPVGVAAAADHFRPAPGVGVLPDALPLGRHEAAHVGGVEVASAAGPYLPSFSSGGTG
jgi:predicted kinase